MESTPAVNDLPEVFFPWAAHRGHDKKALESVPLRRALWKSFREEAALALANLGSHGDSLDHLADE